MEPSKMDKDIIFIFLQVAAFTPLLVSEDRCDTSLSRTHLKYNY